MNKEQAEIIKTLTKARALVKRGWVKKYEELEQGAYVGSHLGASAVKDSRLKVDSYCTIGAIRKADGPGEKGAFKAIRQAIGELFYGGKTRVGEKGIYQFNDRKKTTQEDVLAAFDKAIEMVNVDAES